MPIYATKCNQCDTEWDVLQAYKNIPPPCPNCGSEDTKRLITAPKAFLGFDYKPYDALDRQIPDSKPIKSFANDRRKGGKDTT